MAGLPHVPLFLQQQPIFNQLVQQMLGPIPTLSHPQVTSVQTSTSQGSDSYGSGVQFSVAYEFNPLMVAAQPFNPYTQQYIGANPYMSPLAGQYAIQHFVLPPNLQQYQLYISQAAMYNRMYASPY